MIQAKLPSTDNELKRVKPPVNASQEDHRVAAPLHKEAFKGLWLRVFSSGTKVWIMRARMPGGAQKAIRIGEFPDIGINEAIEKCTAFRNQLRDGVDPREKRKAEATAARVRSMTFRALCAEYLLSDEFKAMRPTTQKQRRNALAHRLFDDWQDKPVSQITTARVNDVMRKIKNPNSHGSYLAPVRRVLSYALERGYLPEVPKITFAAAEGDAEPFLSYSEKTKKFDLSELVGAFGAIAELEAAKPLSPWPSQWSFAAYTGARPFAIGGLRWAELDLGASPVWHLPAERSKLRRAIDIPLSNAAADVLRGIERKNDLVWPGRDGTKPLTYPHSEIGMMNGALAARGFKPTFRMERFRDTFMSWLDANPAATERAIALLVDHKPPRGTRKKHYVGRVQAEDLARDLANAWAGAIESARRKARIEKSGLVVV